MNLIQQIEQSLPSNYKVSDVDRIAKKLIKDNTDVESLLPYVLDKLALHRIYFQVSLTKIKDYKSQMEFIESRFAYLNDWWHVDQLEIFINKNDIDFDYLFNKASKYVTSEMPFVRRWGYVAFISGPQKNPEYFTKIASLFKNDDAYYVQMAEAWLIAELAVNAPEKVYNFLLETKLKYNITGKAVQKICDSFRITDEFKNQCRALRPLLKTR